MAELSNQKIQHNPVLIFFELVARAVGWRIAQASLTFQDRFQKENKKSCQEDHGLSSHRPGESSCERYKSGDSCRKCDQTDQQNI